MDHIRQMEALFSIFLASFEMQINTLHVLKGHRIHSDVHNYTKKLIEALLRTIESIESEFTREIQVEADVTLGQSALLVKTIAKAKKEMPEIEVLHELCNLAKTSHHSFTTSLSDEELRVTAEVSERFAVMKERVSVLLRRIENV